MIDFPQLNRASSRLTIKGFLYHNNRILNSVMGRDEDKSMLKCFNYIMLTGANLKGLKNVDPTNFLRMIRRISRSESRIRDVLIFKKWVKDAVKLSKLSLNVVDKIGVCKHCSKLPEATICSIYFVCSSCKIVFKVGQ